jgi:hypothetical protein
MKLLREEIEEYLVHEPRSRERSNKDRAIVNVLVRRYPELKKVIELEMLSKGTLVSFVQDHNSMDRAWRKVLEERPELRGTDYGEKDKLEADVQEQLGY